MKVRQYLETHYQGKAVRAETNKAEGSTSVDGMSHKRSSGYKKTIGSATFSGTLFRESVRLFLKANSDWTRQGQALIKAVHKVMREVDQKAVA